MELSFVAQSDAMHTVFSAAGIDPNGIRIPACPVQVGDVLSFAEAPQLFWRVAKRVMVGKRPPHECEWMALIEPAPNPIDEHELRQR